MEDRAERWYELMRKEYNRLKTFQMNPPWPKEYVDIKKLAKAGFFYTFRDDKVLCAFCRGQVCRWERNDDPMSEHARHFTTCPFIMGGDVGNEPLGEDPFPGPKRPRPYDVFGIYPNYPPDDDRQSSQQYQNQSANHNNHHDYSEHYIENPPINDYQPRLHHTPAYGGSPSESSITSSPNSLNSLNSNSSRYSPNSLNSNCSMHNPNGSNSNLNGICKICYTNSIEFVFLPCAHSVSCESCAQRLHNCPCCRATITSRIRTYLV